MTDFGKLYRDSNEVGMKRVKLTDAGLVLELKFSVIVKNK